MDGSRFDGWTRLFTAESNRRQAMHGVAGGVFAGLLSHLGFEEAAAACVKPGKKGCAGPKRGKCCQGTRCKGGSTRKEGRCVCLRSLKQCGKECVNTKNDKHNCGSCNKRCAAGHSCKNGKCTSRLGCRAGDSICNETTIVNCPGTDNPNCFCVTDVHGTPHCSDVTVSFCSDCTSNSDCGAGFVCADASRPPNCGCPGGGGGTGNACSPATCDGISGSGAGRREPRTSFLR